MNKTTQMKSRITILLLSIFILACNTASKKEKEPQKIRLLSALEYNNLIVEQQEKVLGALTDYSTMYEYNITKQQANEYEAKTMICIDSAIIKITELKDFKGDTVFLHASLRWFEYYKSLMSNEYREIRSIIEKNERITKEDVKHVNTIHEIITKKEKPVLASFASAQREFAKKFNLILPKNTNKKQSKN